MKKGGIYSVLDPNKCLLLIEMDKKYTYYYYLDIFNNINTNQEINQQFNYLYYLNQIFGTNFYYTDSKIMSSKVTGYLGSLSNVNYNLLLEKFKVTYLYNFLFLCNQ